MISKIKYSAQKSISFGFSDSLNMNHLLYILTHKIAWDTFGTNFSKNFCTDNGRPVKSIRLMVGLLILKYLRNLSYESVVEQWSENVYYQHFFDLEEFVSTPLCASIELVHFRK
jgi:transposase, IS5 family